MDTSTPQPASNCCSTSKPKQHGSTVRETLAAGWRSADNASFMVLIAVAIAVLAPEQLPSTVLFTGRSLASIAPWLALSVLVAAYAKASRADSLVARAFTGSPARMIVLASLFGALSPFCSCGVVPIIACLLGAGVPLAPVMAFWMSSPLMDPNMFIVTAASLGMEFAVIKTIAAIVMGLMSGAATHWLASRGLFSQVLRSEHIRPVSGLPYARPQWNVMHTAETRRLFVAGALSNGWFLLRWMTIAFMLESLMVAYMPAERVASLLGQEASAIPLAVLIGIPAYLNGLAALPLVRGLIDLGMNPAVGLAFLVGGGVTSIPAATAVWALVKPRVFALYLALAVTGSLSVAYAYSAWLALP
ncbi:MAG TPA: permease [Noviherbaspirillum sp.]